MATRVSVPGPEPLERPTRGSETAVILQRIVLGLIVTGAFFALQPLWVPLVLAAWIAIVVKPLHTRLQGKFGRGNSAAVITVVLFVVALAPLVVISLSLVGAAVELGKKLQGTGGFEQSFKTLLATEPSLSLERFDARSLMDMLRRHGMGAVNAARTVFGAATAVLIGVVVFLFGFYTFLVHGRRTYEWLVDNSPIPRRHMIRLADAFAETGKGLLISVGITAVLQGFVATIGYLVIGVPQALVLGLVTIFAALIPSIGTSLVWVPVTIGLFITGRTGAGIAMLAFGAFVSIIDNFARPALSRYGHLQLPMFVVFIAMLGGIAAFGAWGLLAGPLFVRLAVEALLIWREERAIELHA